MVIASAITPTDPVLANSITQGRFADKHVPVNVRNIIVAESGANDGLGYPFIYLALNLILYPDPQYENFDSLRGAIGNWFLEVRLLVLLLPLLTDLAPADAPPCSLPRSGSTRLPFPSWRGW